MADPADVKTMLDDLYAGPSTGEVSNSWAYILHANQDMIMVAALIPLIILILIFLKKQQKKMLDHNQDMFQKNHDMIAKSVGNQEKMVGLLQEISNKLSK
ncbi:MAG: hypothetical protein DHS20C02_06370 [Micavibrio sp.]|nr:MAG: hypothetical protein DHS20C02_06370 [Micavibrio sp.]